MTKQLDKSCYKVVNVGQQEIKTSMGLVLLRQGLKQMNNKTRKDKEQNIRDTTTAPIYR